MRSHGWALTPSSAYITRLPFIAGKVRLGVKDVIDVAGTKTTAGSRLVADHMEVAESNAKLLAGALAEDVCIVGKTNLHELAFGFTGINPHFGTPLNPVSPWTVPGGSSSGSAVVVASGDADIAIGTDSAGSVRMPAACCGTVGLKLSGGRLPLDGVWPLAPTLDTIGVFGQDVASTQYCASLLLNEKLGSRSEVLDLGRLRGLPASAWVESEVDAALDQAGVNCLDFRIESWGAAFEAARTILAYEAWWSNKWLLESFEYGGMLGKDVAFKLEVGARIETFQAEDARSIAAAFEREFAAVLEAVEVIVLPTLPVPPPPLLAPDTVDLAGLTAPVNLGGWPALALPIPGHGGLPASLQLVAAVGAEARLLSTAARIERALR